ncbi:MAG: hypothetical protein ACE5JR_01320 [Gemmatimonadota bacterium]
MRRAVWLRGTAYVSWGVVGLSGLALGLQIAHALAGLWGLILASILFPLTLAVAPWYALFVWRSWLPVLVVYGGGCLATLLLGIAAGSLEE